MHAETIKLALSLPDAPMHLLLHGEQDQHVSRTLRETGVWEPFESRLILEALEEGDCFVDVGANIGYFSILAAQRVGASGQVIAFEPDPENYALLTRSAELNQLKNIQAVKAGLSDFGGTAELHLSADNFGDHQLFPGASKSLDREAISIELLNGSNYLSEISPKADFLKVDVQGAEYQVMLGLMPWLLSVHQRPDILIELTPYSLRQAGVSGRQLLMLLSQLELDFWIVDHINHQLHASDAEALAVWCDNVDSCEDDEGFMNIMLTANREPPGQVI